MLIREPSKLLATHMLADPWNVACLIFAAVAVFVSIFLLVLALRDTSLDAPLDDCETDICGLCGKPGADKAPCQYRWPGERLPNTSRVHEHCENAETSRAMLAMTPVERRRYLQSAFD